MPKQCNNEASQNFWFPQIVEYETDHKSEQFLLPLRSRHIAKYELKPKTKIEDQPR